MVSADWAKKYEIDHIGIAVRSLEEGRRFYEALGVQDMPIEEVPTEKVRVGFINIAGTARIELLEPTSTESPIHRFLEKRGPGIHHICLKVSDIRATLAELKAKGLQLINEEPRPGAHGCEVAFVHPKSAGGVLVELSQTASEAKS